MKINLTMSSLQKCFLIFTLVIYSCGHIRMHVFKAVESFLQMKSDVKVQHGKQGTAEQSCSGRSAMAWEPAAPAAITKVNKRPAGEPNQNQSRRILDLGGTYWMLHRSMAPPKVCSHCGMASVMLVLPQVKGKCRLQLHCSLWNTEMQEIATTPLLFISISMPFCRTAGRGESICICPLS